MASAIFVCISLCQPASVMAQVFDVAPIKIWVNGRYDPDGQFGQFVIGTKRAIPVFDLLPQVSADSYFDAMRIVIGIQRDDDRNRQRFRYRASALETEILKSPWGGHFTILDFDSRGLEDLWADWIALGLGPGFSVGSDQTQIIVRAFGDAAFNSFRFGDGVFSKLGGPAGKTRTGLAYGVSGRVSIIWLKHLMIRGTYDGRWSTAGQDVRKDEIEVTVDVSLGSNWSVFGKYAWLNAEISTISEDRNTFGGGIRFTAGTAKR